MSGSGSRSGRDTFYFVVLILTLITMIVGVTFTFYSLMASDKKDSTIVKTGTLSINYIDGKKINASPLVPMEEPSLNSSDFTYKKSFSVTSDGTLDQTLDLYINITSNSFANGDLRFSLYDSENVKIATGSFPKSGKILMKSGDYLKSGETKSYTVLIWLQENYQNQDYDKESTFVGGFEIEANQVKLK